MTVHRAGERGQPVAQVARGETGRTMRLPAGIYDCQAVQEREGRALNIRWAERLVVMTYPDEGGHHLEVINFTTGYGALQVRASSDTGEPFEVALFGSGQRDATRVPRRRVRLQALLAASWTVPTSRSNAARAPCGTTE